MSQEPIDVVFTHVSATRQFKGIFGPFWTIVHCYIARRQEIKMLATQVKLSEAQAKTIAEETNREISIAYAKTKAITERCKSDVHEVNRWVTGTSWEKRNRFSDSLLESYTIMHGRCIHCGSPVAKRHYSFPPDKE